MRKVIISDVTVKMSKRNGEDSLTFREKLELAKLLDRLGVSYIETGVIENRKTDGLLIKSLSSAIKDASLTVPVPVGEEDGIEYTWSCLSEAKSPRLQVALPVSTVQMEYFYHKKPEKMLSLISETVSKCRSLCPDVEFSAEDAGRADGDFLFQAIDEAIKAGAATVTVCDTAGNMLPDEFAESVKRIKAHIGNVRLGVKVSNNIYLADSCAVSAVTAGADEVKTAAYGELTASLERVAAIIDAKKDAVGAEVAVRVTELHRTAGQIRRLCESEKSKNSPFDTGVRDDGFLLNVHDDLSSVIKAAEKLGYDLSEDDAAKVYEAFASVADKKDTVSAKELDVLIASSALQVPPTYKLDSYVINSGNVITATSHIKLTKNGETKEGISVGDGPIDAAFLAIEQIVGTHYELDDFQIRAVTEGREAMGETVVRLRSGGKLYSGRGISTDIVGSSIQAYINALNKIVYEEEQA